MDRSVFLGFIDNLRLGTWHVIGCMSYADALACVARSSEPRRLKIIDADTNASLPKEV